MTGQLNFSITRDGGNSVNAQLIAGLKALAETVGVGGKLPSEAELCQTFNLSRTTVNRALNELEHQNVIERFQGKGSFVKAAPAPKIYYLSSPLNIMEKHDANSLMVQSIYYGILQGATNAGMNVETVVVCQTDYRKDIDLHKLDSIPDGSRVVLLGYWFARTFDTLLAKNCQVAIITRQEEVEKYIDPKIAMWQHIEIQRFQGTISAVKHLFDAGKRRIALIHNKSCVENPFRQGYRQGFAQCGLAFDDKLEMHVGDDIEAAYEQINQMIIMRPGYEFDAILTSTPFQAIGALQSLRDNNLSGEIGIISLEDNELLLSPGHIGVSGINLNYQSAGASAVNALIHRHNEPQRIKIGYNLVTRQTH